MVLRAAFASSERAGEHSMIKHGDFVLARAATKILPYAAKWRIAHKETRCLAGEGRCL